MGGGSSQSSQSQGTSGGSNTFSSTPINQSNPFLYAMGPTVETGLSGMINNFGQYGQTNMFGNQPGFTPYGGTGPGGAYNAGDVNANPLVAPMTAEQQAGLSNVNSLTANQNFGQNSAALTAIQNAYGNPGMTLSGNAAGNAFNTGVNNFGGAYNFANAAGQPWNFTNPLGNAAAAGNVAMGGYGGAQNQITQGANTANAAGGVAGQILPNVSNPLNAGINTAMNGSYGGGTATQGMQAAQRQGFGRSLANAAGQFAGVNQNLQPASAALRREMDPNFAASLATSPQTLAAVQAAINPLLNTFNTQTVPGLQGMFTAAGQRVNSAAGVGGSSAFDIAGANAMTGLGANIGQTAQGIINPAYQTGLNIAANAPGQFAGLQQQKLSGLESAATTKAQVDAQKVASLDQAALTKLQTTTGKSAAQLQAAAAAGTLTAQESAALAAASGAQTQAGVAQGGLTTAQSGALAQAANAGTGAAAGLAGAQTGAANAITNAAGTQTGALNATANVGQNISTGTVNNLINAATGAQGVSTSQIDNAINSLGANALPQMTQQYGINQGLSLYNSQINQLLTALGLGAQSAQPQLASLVSGAGNSFGQNSSSSSGKSAGLSPIRF